MRGSPEINCIYGSYLRPEDIEIHQSSDANKKRDILFMKLNFHQSSVLRRNRFIHQLCCLAQ